MEERKERPLSTSDIAGISDDERVTGSRTAAATVERRPAEDADAGRTVTEENAAASPLFAPEEGQGYRTRWDAIQTGFVDEPRKAVEEADALVADVMKRLAEGFAKERTKLESQWDRGDKISTEDLRLALRRYRSFFQRLLNI
ncbi:MAG: hypothetical protein ACM3NQ_20445 [Bacteroidales bacterium]